MVDFSAASASMWQAFLGMIDLALESFTVPSFRVLLNPCFLARLGIDRTQAMAWLGWAETAGHLSRLGRGRKARGICAAAALFPEHYGLQRLRLGRYMDIAGADADGPAPRFEHVIPFADLGSTDREQLDAFCRAVEGLLPALAHLRTAKINGVRSAHRLNRLVREFLDVPADRAEEGQVHQLLAGIEQVEDEGCVAEFGARGRAAEYLGPGARVRAQPVQTLQGNRGEYLVGGVSIAALQPMRPVPFAVVYILGLEENLTSPAATHFRRSICAACSICRGIFAPPRRTLRFAGDGSIRR